MTQQVTQLIVDARGAKEGTAEFVRAMNAAQAAYDRSLDREEKLRGSVDQTNATLTRGAGSVTNIARKWQQLQASIDPVAAAHNKANAAIEKGVLAADAAYRRGIASQEETIAVVERLRAKVLSEVEAVEKSVAAANDNAAALARLRTQYDPLFAAQERNRESLRGINDALSQGAISEGVANSARRASLQAMQQQVAALTALETSYLRVGMAQAGKGGSDAYAKMQANLDASNAFKSLSYTKGTVQNDAELAAYAKGLDEIRAKYDPVFRAGQQFRAELYELRKAFKDGAISQEVFADNLSRLRTTYAEQAAAVNGLTKAQREAADEAQRGARAQTDAANKLRVVQMMAAQTTPARNRGEDIEAVGQQLDRLQAKYDPLFAAQKEYIKNLAEVRNALYIGAIDQDVFRVALQKIKDEFADQIRGLKGIKEAQVEVGLSAVEMARRAQQAWSTLGAQGAAALANIEASRRLGSLTNTGGTVIDDAGMNRAREKYDEVFRAANAYRAGLQELRADLAAGAISQDVYTAALARQKAAFTEQMAALGRLSKAQRDQAKATEDAAKASAIQGAGERAAKEALDYAQGLSKLRAELVPAYKAQTEFDAAVAKANTALAVGAIKQDEHATAIGAARARLLDQTTQSKLADEANKRLRDGVGLSAYAWTNLSYQVNDVFTQLASGTSITQTFAQQFGQVFQILQGGNGGVVGALKAIRDQLVALTVAYAPVIGLVGLFAGLAFAANRYITQQNEVEKSLLGVGRASGATALEIEKVAKANASAGDVSVATAKEVASAFAATGKIPVEAFGLGIRAIKDYAAATRQEIPAATEQLAGALASLADGGFDKIRESTRSFDAETTDAIRTLIRENDTLGAISLTLRTLERDLDGSAAKVERYGSFWASVGRTISNVTTTIGEAATKALDTTFTNDPALQLERQIRTKKFVGLDTSEQEKRLADLRRAMAETEAKSGEVAQKARENARVTADASIAAVIPQVKALKDIQAEEVKLNALRNSREAQGDTTSPDYKNAGIALEALVKARRDYEFAADKGGLSAYKRAQQIEAETAALQAKEPADRANAARMKAVADQIGAIIPRQERYQQQNEASNKVLREQAQASQDASRVMNDETAANNRVASATAQRTNSVLRLAAAAKVDAEITAGRIDRSEREKKIGEELASQYAQTNKQLAETIRKNKDGAAANDAYNAKVRAGAMATAEAARAKQQEAALADTVRERDAASGEAKQNLTDRINEQRAANEALNSSEDTAKVLALTEAEKLRIEILEKEIETLGLTTRERAKALAVLQAEMDLKKQGISTTSPDSKAYLDKVALRSDLDTTKQEFERLASDVSSAVSGIFDDMFKSGEKGLKGFFDSFSRGFARIGTRLIEQNIIAPLVNQALGGAGGSGGLGGLNFGASFDKIGKAVSEGSFDGLVAGFKDLFGGSSQGGAAGGAGKLGGFGLGSGVVSAGVGASIGYQSQSPLVGGLGGALSGFATGGPVGAVVGGLAGLVGGLFGKSQAKKEAKRKLEEQQKAMREAYEEAKPQIDQLQKVFRGEGVGIIGGQIDQAFSQAVAANKTASQGGDQPRADQIMKDFVTYSFRLRDQFVDVFEGTLSEVARGFGTGGPFSQAHDAIVALGDTLKGFVADALKLPDGAANGQRARLAAQQAALSSLDPAPTLSDTQQALARIQGTASGLTRILMDLGMSATDAGAAIRDRTDAAIKALRDSFNADLDSKINEASGKDYLNEVGDLLKERGTLLADAAAVGGDTEKVSAYFKAAAQSIVDDAQLTGDAFKDLVKQFPALNGVVVEFSEALDDAAAKVEAANRRLAYQDRAFAASNDASTLAGALAAQERKAAQDRAAEQKAGNGAAVDLELALAAEREAIIRDFGKRAADEAAAAEAERLRKAEEVADRVRSAEDRLFAARNDTSTLTGQLDALDRQHADEVREERRAGGEALVALERAQGAERLRLIEDFNKRAVEAQRQALEEARNFLNGATKTIRGFLDDLVAGPQTALSPGDRLAEAQKQYDAQLALAKGGDRDAMGSITQYASNLLDAGRSNFSSGQGYQDILKSVQQSLGDLPSQVSAEQFIVDAINKSTTDLGKAINTNNPTAIATALDANFTKLDTNLDGRLSSAEFVAGLGPLATKDEQEKARALFDKIDQNGDGFIDAQEKARFDLVTAIQANSPDLIKTALSTEFDKLDTDNSGGLTEDEFVKGLGPLATAAEQEAARLLFKAMDENGDGTLSEVELMRGQLKGAIEANSPGLIEAALRTNFDKIDTTANGLLDKKELIDSLGPLATAQQQADALAVFNRIDTNGDGQLSEQELIRSQLKTAIEANSPALIQKALSLDFAKLDAVSANTKGSLTIAEFKAGLGNLATKAEQDAAELLFKSMDENGDDMLSETELMHGQLKTALETNSPANIATALNTNFTKLDTTMNGRLNKTEFLAGLGNLATKEQADAAKKVFDAIDKDGDGQITSLDSILYELKTNLGSPTAIATALNDNFKMLDKTADKAIDLKEFTDAIGPLATKDDQKAAKLIFDSIDKNGDKLLTEMELANSDIEKAVKANSPSAIATALNTNFTTLADKTKGGITKAEFEKSITGLATKGEQTEAMKVFKNIDKDGNDIVTKTEAVRFELLDQLKSNNPAKIASALKNNFDTLTTATNGRLTSAQLVASLGPLATKKEQTDALAVFKSIDKDGNDVITKLDVVKKAVVDAVAANNAKAFAAEIDKSFTDLDTRVDGVLDAKELKAAISGLSTDSEIKKANAWLKLMDTDNDGMLTKTETIRARMVDTSSNTYNTKTATDGVKTNTGATKDLSADIKKLLGTLNNYTNASKTAIEATRDYSKSQKELLDSIKGYQATSDANLKLAKESLDTMKTSATTQEATLEALNGQFTLADPVTIHQFRLQNNMVEALNKIVFNTANTVIGLKSGAAYAYSKGGLVTGPGTATSDSITAQLSNGEFVMTAAATKANRAMLEAMNDNPNARPAGNVVPFPVPFAAPPSQGMPAVIQGPSYAELLQEVRRLTRQVEGLTRVTKDGADRQVRATEEVRNETAGHRDDDDRRDRRRSTGVAGARG